MALAGFTGPLAFERFLGRTFRGEIGQFFTPRTIVEFMVRMLAPREGDMVCDPASESVGFLIRFFELVREQILADVDRQYQAFVAELDRKNHSEAKRAELLRGKYAELQATIDQRKEGSRLWTLANRCISGCDANDRMARTSKMNMIMHGDGHGGVHHHNGFLNMGAVSFGVFDAGQNKAIPTKLAAQPDLEVKVGDLLISRANITRLVGACALVRQTRPGLMLCDKVFRAVWRDPSPVDLNTSMKS